jgi:hypothetical protein
MFGDPGLGFAGSPDGVTGMGAAATADGATLPEAVSTPGTVARFPRRRRRRRLRRFTGVSGLLASAGSGAACSVCETSDTGWVAAGALDPALGSSALAGSPSRLSDVFDIASFPHGPSGLLPPYPISMTSGFRLRCPGQNGFVRPSRAEVLIVGCHGFVVSRIRKGLDCVHAFDASLSVPIGRVPDRRVKRPCYRRMNGSS